VAEARVAIIGGSGFYEMEGLKERHEVRCQTPFGEPSDALVVGSLGDVPVAFLARHGRGHRLQPSEIPARANVYALKTLGVERIISVNAVGSLREEIAPRDLVVPDQLIDRTTSRPSTFFSEGLVASVSMGDPFCPELSGFLLDGARQTEATTHAGGTVVVMEGPAFSTKAESLLYRAWGADLINMTMLPEAKLAREAGICYAALACVTDYDVWRDPEAEVTAQMILDNLVLSVTNARRAVALTIERVPPQRGCRCAFALRDAIVTSISQVPATTLAKLRPIIADYLVQAETADGGE
jgi:5'-methylthioadenosine phosphorylase